MFTNPILSISCCILAYFTAIPQAMAASVTYESRLYIVSEEQPYAITKVFVKDSLRREEKRSNPGGIAEIEIMNEDGTYIFVEGAQDAMLVHRSAEWASGQAKERENLKFYDDQTAYLQMLREELKAEIVRTEQLGDYTCDVYQYIEPTMKVYHQQMGEDIAQATVSIWVWQKRAYPPIRSETPSPFGKVISTVHDLRFDVELDEKYFRIPQGVSVERRPGVPADVVLASDESWLKGIDPQSIERKYLPSGRLLRVSIMKDGQRHGLTREYFDSGVLWKEEIYDHGNREGLFKTYYGTGQLNVEDPYQNNKLNGIRKQYWQDGQVSREHTYKDGILEGLERSFYENGQMRSEVMWHDDKREGMAREFYENGQVEIEQQYIHNQTHGLYRRFNQYGQLQSVSQYENGQHIKTTKFSSE